jgi:hypothetical protein
MWVEMVTQRWWACNRQSVGNLVELWRSKGDSSRPISDLEMVCTIARSTRPSIAEAASKDISHALLNGELPEGSPFRDPDSLECQEASDSDNPPLENGENGLPEGSEADTLPGPEALRRGQELLEELGIATRQGQKPGTAGLAARPQVDAQVVAVAVMMLYKAMITANGGSNPFLTEEGEPRQQGSCTIPSSNPDTGSPATDQPPRSPNHGGIGGHPPPQHRGRPS